jgi:hypothetical protein
VELWEIVHVRNALAKAVFCLAAAVTAAAVIDPAIEWLANAGLFGPGRFTDHSNLDVIPVLVLGLLFSVIFVAGQAHRIVRRFASEVGSIPMLLPVIFALQLLVLWSMETGHYQPRASRAWVSRSYLAVGAGAALVGSGCRCRRLIHPRTLCGSRTEPDAAAFARIRDRVLTFSRTDSRAPQRSRAACPLRITPPQPLAFG